MITEGVITVVPRPVAVVAVAEKGYLSVELVAKSEGGHSSMPPPQTNVGVIAAAVARLEADQMSTSLDGPAGAMIDWLAPEARFGARLVLANRWLLGALIRRAFTSAPSGNALVRTTTAPTVFEGSPKDNVLPARARAVVNFRIRPGDSIDGVLAHVRGVVADKRVEIQALKETISEPSRISSIDSPGWRLLEKTIRQRFPDAVVVPGLVVGATDSRHYQALGVDTYRFLPFRVNKADLARIHGQDERIKIDNLVDGVGFYAQLMSSEDALE
jgi:carboxypeptidase PM20D1